MQPPPRPGLAPRSQIWDTQTVKVAKFHPAALNALRSFPEEIRRAFGKAIHDLQQGHALGMPLSRAMPLVGTGAAELRIRDSVGVYRAFYLVKVADAVLIFHAFAKKTQKTPDREIQLGIKRLKEMLR
jgi:phage-related protein